MTHPSHRPKGSTPITVRPGVYRTDQESLTLETTRYRKLVLDYHWSVPTWLMG